MTKIWFKRVSLVLLSVMFGSVHGADQTLENVYWRTMAIGDEAISVTPQQVPHVAFHAQDNRVAGFGGCNRFFATYEQNDDKLKITIMGGGRASCPETNTLEQDFMRALQLTEQFRRDGNSLLFLKGEKTLLKFVGVEQ